MTNKNTKECTGSASLCLRSLLTTEEAEEAGRDAGGHTRATWNTVHHSGQCPVISSLTLLHHLMEVISRVDVTRELGPEPGTLEGTHEEKPRQMLEAAWDENCSAVPSKSCLSDIPQYQHKAMITPFYRREN